MQRIDHQIRELVREAFQKVWNQIPEAPAIQVQKTRRDFEGEYTVVVFPLLRITRMSPEKTAETLGKTLLESSPLIRGYNVVKGFLNLTVSQDAWLQILDEVLSGPDLGLWPLHDEPPVVVIEYASPNTNKPLHLGHIRNILIGHSVSLILEATGHRVEQVNLVNDRGIHICKSMLAWQENGGGETPGSSGIKGDHLVGKYYVEFDRQYKKEVEELAAGGLERKVAEQQAPSLQRAREMLRRWEAGDADTYALWERMNRWVYEGFEATYQRLGVQFDKIYYESDTFRLGREIVLRGLEEGILYKQEDGSIWADLESEGLDQKLLLRADGTSVYMTQDVGTAQQRHEEYRFDRHIYVVGNEQNYHFQVLSLILKKLGYDWCDRLFHLSYGMVELPEGRMKSREGTVVDADDLMDEMEATARTMSEELGKLEEYDPEERQEICRKVGLGALKYFILKVDPKKNMTFDPRESVDFNGHTGPFIQYTYARIRSVLRKGAGADRSRGDLELNPKEISLVRWLYDYPEVVRESGRTYNPSLIANYLYELSREFNQFYHDHSILGADVPGQVGLRLQLAEITGRVIEEGMKLLGIEVPERM